MKKRLNLIVLTCLALLSVTLTSCKKDDDDPGSDSEKVLVIDNGARSASPDEQVTYTAHFVSSDGSVSAANGVTWSSTESGIVGINASGSISASGIGSTVIEAKIVEDGVTYTASVPLNIVGSTVFAVVPSAIIWEANGGSLQLENVYFGTSTPTYTYASSDDNVASVSASGSVNFKSAGSCVITVTSSVSPSAVYNVPVLVVGVPSVTLPVSRVEVSPSTGEMFRNETLQFTAKAYNTSGEVSESFTWSTSDAAIASIDGNGKVTAKNVGEAVIYAEAKGIIGQAEVYVSPDTIVLVTPFNASITAGGSKQFTATAYDVKNNMAPLNGVTNFDWTIPTYGFSIFDFASVNSSGLVSVRNDALPGNLTFLLANVSGSPQTAGAAAISVSLCDCGNGNPNVASIDISPSSLNISIFSNPTAQVNATGLDANGNAVSNADLRYCSDNTSVAIVDEFTGEVTGSGPGNATISVCSGAYAESSIPVTVNF